VYHAAGVVDDTAIPAITAETLTKVFAPKADGAVNLDRALGEAGIGLDHFVLYSSMSALMGGYTQLTYSAANAMLQAVAFNRRRRGERALCVDWGAMGGGGMAEATDEAARFLSALGFTPINMDVAAEMLGECLRLDLTHVALMDIDWATAFTASRAVAHSPRFAEHAAAAKAGRSGVAALRADILALPPEQRGEIVSYLLAEQLAIVMGVAADAVDLEVALPDLGLDSLMAVEFIARVSKTVGVELTTMDIIGGQKLSGIGAKVTATLEDDRKAEAA
jgi:acyl carrier protein